ncbi:sugar kinase [Caloramator sp. E03]|uniref:sugar kinase n=1 Tax=Caloramator sp. E03 TaxID=2576307 RepID=UPI00111030E0|nr:sugar kinase [Caloramator sp. E03]QCX33668.1 sugar kinase [Caloramator sp. E03]
MSKFVTFGEIMLRLAPIGYERFIQAKEFSVVYGGGEANVAVSLANYGKDAYFVTKVPKHEIGQCAVNELRKYGVKTDYIARGGERLGIYFCEKGASQRPSKVIYDRAHSSISEATSEDFNWDEIFKDAQWFHFTGITPALSDNCANLTLEAVKKAKEKGVIVSCDLNYRKKLWSSEKAGKIMGEIVKYCDVVIANEEDAEKVFGIKADATDIESGKLSEEGYRKVAKELYDRFNLKYVAITLRESYSASDNGWSAMIYDGKEFIRSRKYDMRIVDRVGGGDSFAGGLIYGLSSGMSSKDALEFAVAASCLKHSIEGDFNLVSKEEVETLMKGDASGRVQR